MISGRFGEEGELIFEIELIAKNGEIIPVDTILDTGFTTGYLAIPTQDIEVLGWEKIRSNIMLSTAQGMAYFDIYEGRMIMDEQEFTIPVHAGDNLPEILIGVLWLDAVRIVIDKGAGILTLEIK
ncbi:MAG: aspartyl protease [Okeania sp. SIO2C2]|uniref:aspartyl protease n=1 Tax=unclassified Okeania TaxID=2634635 RepID=UPI0013BBBF35|nr:MULTISPECIES: aspartyl protease [unclassified Okeania]NEP07558.1 aspartyl protease [Okeania sp. SIO4D6]NEP43819.1 aspartyl protease [Okeania sp. SIO2H7]NEP72465.1 aspartyl protease [Okeania sp. SIO2G5]NEP89308.1 aspartyl protease [Okeania sp. SIO2C2]NEP93126.1 aspartyl protease [Okeania sp. SIO2F5]